MYRWFGYWHPLPILLVVLATSHPTFLHGQTWTDGAGNGSWPDDGNWSPSPFPDNPNASATITLDISASEIITLDRPVVNLNGLTVGDSTSPYSGYTIAPGTGGALRFHRSVSSGANALIISQNGNNLLSARVESDLVRLSITNVGTGTTTFSELARIDGGVFRFTNTGSFVTPGGGMISSNGIGNVWATFNDADWVTYNPTTGQVGRLTSYSNLASGGATSNVSLTGNATLATTKTINSLRFISQTGGQSINLGANNLTIASGGIMRSSGEHNYSINGTGSLITPGELVLHNNSSNQLTINARVSSNGLTINSGGNTSGAGRIIFANATNDYGSGDINLIRGLLRFTNATTFSGDVNISAGAANLELHNAGTFTFNGDLEVNGTVSSTQGATALVSSGSTLRGYGVSQVASVIRGSVDPGGDGLAGTLGFTRTLTLDAGSNTIIDLYGNTPGDAGSFYDQINMTSATGSVAIASGASLAINVGINFNLMAGDVFYILTRADAGTYGFTFSGLEEGATVASGNWRMDITYLANWTGDQGTSSTTGGNDIALYNARLVPEPTAAVLLLLGGAVYFLASRRR